MRLEYKKIISNFMVRLKFNEIYSDQNIQVLLHLILNSNSIEIFMPFQVTLEFKYVSLKF